MSCDWRVDGQDGPTELRATGQRPVVLLQEGSYCVMVFVRLADGRTGAAREIIAAKETWIVRARDSEQIQGPRLSIAGYIRGLKAPGTLHPNRQGHQLIADRLLESVAARRTHSRREVLARLPRPLQAR